jgi:hypothetical protein
MIAKNRALSPAEIGQLRIDQTPDAVFEAINELLAANLNDKGEASFFLSEAIAAISSKLSTLPAYGLTSESDRRGDIVSNGWLNFEDAYRKRGWNVVLEATPEGGNKYYVFRDET